MRYEVVVAYFKGLFQYLPGETEKEPEQPVRIVGLRAQESNPVPPKYEAAALTFQPRCSPSV